MTVYTGSSFTADRLENYTPGPSDLFAPAGTSKLTATESDYIILRNSGGFDSQIICDTCMIRASQYDNGITSPNTNWTNDTFLVIDGFDVGVDGIYNDSITNYDEIAGKIDINQNGIVDAIIGRNGELDNPLSGDITDIYYIVLDVSPEELGYGYSMSRGAYTRVWSGLNPEYVIDSNFINENTLFNAANAV